ncbi:nucleotide-diphospho-sugar transferase-domain-containing protein [Paraphysoderma sedebokerense]|nr:nucleotide-diphospho-sugar transferase-domain-containing protein [Paraphysoderma sedebokerense]
MYRRLHSGPPSLLLRSRFFNLCFLAIFLSSSFYLYTLYLSVKPSASIQQARPRSQTHIDDANQLRFSEPKITRPHFSESKVSFVQPQALAQVNSPSPTPDSTQSTSRPDIRSIVAKALGVYESDTVNSSDRTYTNDILVVSANYAYRSFLHNWICHVRKSNYKFLVIAQDDQLADYLEDYNSKEPMDGQILYLSGKLFGATSSSVAGAYNTPVFNHISVMKLVAVRNILQLGHNVFFSDVDIAFLHQNPLSFIPDSIDFSFQQDQSNFVTSYTYPYICTGFYYLRSSPSTIALLQTSEKLCQSKPKWNDQDCVNDVLRRWIDSTIAKLGVVKDDKETIRLEQRYQLKLKRKLLKQQKAKSRSSPSVDPSEPSVDEIDQNLQPEPEGSVKLTYYPLSPLLFPNGYRYFFKGRKLYEELLHRTAIQPLIAHVNWVRGMEKKKKALVERGLWRWDEEESNCARP